MPQPFGFFGDQVRVPLAGFLPGSVQRYKMYVAVVKTVGQAFLESGASLLLLYAMVPMLFAGIGAQLDWLQVMGRMIFLNLLLYFAPTPGGAGVAEGLFISSFKAFLPLGTVGVAAVAWRIFAEYLPACIGGYFTLKVFGSKGIQNK